MEDRKVTIVFYKDGQEVKKDVIIRSHWGSEEMFKGHNNIEEVQFDSDKIGYFKDSSKTSKAFFDKLEYIICQIGKILGIKMAETYKVYDDSRFSGIISESIFDSKKEKMYMAQQLLRYVEEPTDEFNKYINDMNQLRINNNVQYKRPNGDIWNIPTVSREEDIEKVLNFFPNVIKEIEKDEQHQQEMRSDYYKMIMLDLITNNIDRNNNNYGIVVDENEHSRFSPLFDNSTTHIPGLPDNKARINGFMIDRKKLLEVLFKNHYKEIEPIVHMCHDEKSEMLEYIRKISNQNLEENEANYFLEIITNNILEISNFEKKKRENKFYGDSEKNNSDKTIEE